eukprot:4408911-Pyramimonas_sp.AAC.1
MESQHREDEEGAGGVGWRTRRVGRTGLCPVRWTRGRQSMSARGRLVASLQSRCVRLQGVSECAHTRGTTNDMDIKNLEVRADLR